MALTPEQREARRDRVHSSDMPAICGVSPWAGPVDVYYQKAYPSEDRKTDAMEAGDYLEPVILKWLSDKFHVELHTDLPTFHHPDGLNGCNLDGRIDSETIVEAKSAGCAGWHPGIFDEWGEQGTDQVPDMYNIQAQHAMAVTGAKRCILGAFLAGRGPFNHYLIERNDRLAEALLAEGRRFMQEHVIPKVPPAGIPGINAVKYIVRKERSRKVFDLSNPDHETEWITLSGLARLIEERKPLSKLVDDSVEAVKAVLLAHLGEYEEAEIDGGLITYHKDKRGSRRLFIRWNKKEEKESGSESVDDSTGSQEQT